MAAPGREAELALFSTGGIRLVCRRHGSGEPEGNGACLRQAGLPAGKQAEATRFPFPLPPPTVGEQKAKVNTFLHFLLLSAATPSSTH